MRQRRHGAPLLAELTTQTHTMNGSATPAVAFIATPTTISAMPAIGWRWNINAMPAAIRPTISISLCTPPIRWISTSGLSTQPQRGRAVAAEVAGQPRGGPDQQRQARQHAQPQQHRARDDVVADDHGDDWPTRMNVGPYGAVVVVQTADVVEQ